ncbi:MAG: hypothetical protein Q8J64_08500 [Thermodesulfovibrionales bacterium]|nr:hypothetical protein [Thermodesulfovibrionales bacterium]
MPEAFIFGSEIMDFFYGIALSTIAASIFYLFQVFIPEKRKQKILKENFKLNYTQFKGDCISIFLSALGDSYNSQLPKELLNLEEFKKYFKENFKGGQNRWAGVGNGLNDRLLKDLLAQLEILSQEIDFFLNNVSLHDEEVFAFLKRLKIAAYSLKNTSLDYDEIKTLLQFLWELFAGWSFISGYRKNDIFEEMLDKV